MSFDLRLMNSVLIQILALIERYPFPAFKAGKDIANSRNSSDTETNSAHFNNQ
jgi:hypothetical protein